MVLPQGITNPNGRRQLDEDRRRNRRDARDEENTPNGVRSADEDSGSGSDGFVENAPLEDTSSCNTDAS